MTTRNPLTINISSTCGTNGSPPYVFANREDYFRLGVPLYQASSTGDWEAAKLIFEKYPDLVRFGLSKNLGTALHVAVTSNPDTNNFKFVKNLLHMMTMDDLELKNEHSNTAFWEAAAFGNSYTVKRMFKMNDNLLNIRGSDGLLPLSASALFGETATVKYLYRSSQKMSGDQWTDNDRNFTLWHCVERNKFGVALQILEDCPELARNVSLLEVLARKSSIFYKIYTTTTKAKQKCNALKVLKIIWGHATKTMDIDEIENMLRGPATSLADGTALQYSSRILFVAAESGNTEFIVELIRVYPHLIVETNDDGLTIFHIAVMHRHVGIYNLLYEIGGSYKKTIFMIKDKSDNNIVHLVGKTSKVMATENSEASLLMQRELLWFHEVYWMMPSHLRKAKNKYGQTPRELFFNENKDQLSKGLERMKDCMVVATLIVTVAFAGAFTVPGGYNQDHGPPILIHKRTFLVFVIADVVTLFSSSTSLLVFLSVLSSRHHHFDFLESLPRKLMVGLLTLFISVAAMMVTFSASFFVLYHNGLKWVPLLIAISATLPVIVFARMQFPLLVDMYRSVYDSHYLFRPKKRMLYNPKA